MNGRSALRPRTVRALANESPSFVTAILDVVSEDFLQWDGTIPDESIGQERRQDVRAGLRLCLSIDRVSGVARSTLRCRSQTEIPESGLRLNNQSLGEPLACEEFVPGWSRPLVSPTSAVEYSPMDQAWVDGLT
ncbi:MAG: hypothetical protein ACYCOU_06665, partial [Sulfobacillus sp.]